jgi:O-antigen ligase
MNKVITGSVIVTLITTPWVSSDALIIPKIIAVTCLAFYLIPEISSNVRSFVANKNGTFVSLLIILFIAQMLIALILSEAPIEQQFFGRTGRGLGFLTYFSIIVVFSYVYMKIDFKDLFKISQGLFLSCLISSGYSIVQYLGIDFSDWRTQTNGIIGTIGNPNFQSSFIAIAFIPTVVYLWNFKNKYLLVATFGSIFLFTLYICESTQGYIALLAALAFYLILFLWYQKTKIYFAVVLISTFILGIIAFSSMLNKGPLSYYLYKVSVRSRGEMWDTAFSIIKSNPLFGVGLDSIGDYSLKYRSQKTANGIDEYIDNVHNFFLQFAATGGLFLAILYFAIVVYTLYSFFILQKIIGRFDSKLTALAAAWLSFQLQSLISPAAIPSLLWNFVISGAVIGLGVKLNSKSSLKVTKNSNEPRNAWVRIMQYPLVVLSLFLTIPLFNADRLARQADLKKDALLAVKAAKTYPESVIRYNRLGAGLYESGLYDLSLEIGRSAVEFNSESYLTWIIILVNPNATIQERMFAKNKLIEIDPYNNAIQEYKF